MGKKALIVGINYIGTPSELHGCISDAQRIKHLLINNLGFKDEDIIYVTDDQTDIKFKPTKNNIVKYFNKLIVNAKLGDVLFFTYSGHGSQILDISGDEDERKDEVLVPLDYKLNGLIVDDWIQSMVQLLPKGVKLFSLLDSCNSGSAFDLKYIVKETKPPTSNVYTYSFTESKKYAITKADVCMLSGCRDDQYSVDTVVNNIPTGALTQAFITVLSNSN